MNGGFERRLSYKASLFSLLVKQHTLKSITGVQGEALQVKLIIFFGSGVQRIIEMNGLVRWSERVNYM